MWNFLSYIFLLISWREEFISFGTIDEVWRLLNIILLRKVFVFRTRLSGLVLSNIWEASSLELSSRRAKISKPSSSKHLRVSSWDAPRGLNIQENFIFPMTISTYNSHKPEATRKSFPWNFRLLFSPSCLHQWKLNEKRDDACNFTTLFSFSQRPARSFTL